MKPATKNTVYHLTQLETLNAEISLLAKQRNLHRNALFSKFGRLKKTQLPNGLILSVIIRKVKAHHVAAYSYKTLKLEKGT